METQNPVTIYTSVNSGGYDVQIWYDHRMLTGNRFGHFTTNADDAARFRRQCHDWADTWLDASAYKDLPRNHKL